MSYLSEWQPLSNAGREHADVIRGDFRRYMWERIEREGDLVVAGFLWWKIRVKDLHWLFERMLGANPYA